MKRGTGARGLRAVLEESMLDVMYDHPVPLDVIGCTISNETVRGEAPPLLTFRGEREKRGRRKPRQKLRASDRTERREEAPRGRRPRGRSSTPKADAEAAEGSKANGRKSQKLSVTRGRVVRVQDRLPVCRCATSSCSRT
jgi:hypothetical protein